MRRDPAQLGLDVVTAGAGSEKHSRRKTTTSEAEGKRMSAEHAGLIRGSGSPATTRPTICLAMIVRDESQVIARCLRSVRDHIDTWVICDTGSTDDTIRQVEAELDRIPGKLYRRPWRNFGHNRTELMELARASGADYLVLLDADMTVEAEPGALEHLDADAYMLPVSSEMTYWMPYLVRASLPWRYEGATHEYITTDRPHRRERLAGFVLYHHADGGSRHDKFVRDRELLAAELDSDPGNSRAAFYLAQTLRDLGERRKAIEAYRRRIAMGGWDEEVFYSMYQVGMLTAVGDWERGVDLLLAAWEARPTRAEPLYDLAAGMRQRGRNQAAYLFAARGIEIPEPEGDSLFVNTWVYRWGLRFEHSVAAYWVGRFEEALADCEELAGIDLPEPWNTHVRDNRSFCLKALGR